MIRRLLISTAFVCAAAAPVLAQSPTAIDPARLSEHVRVLASDEFEGRGIGTAGEQKTIDYMSRAFAAAGFEPGGPGGSWTQDVSLRRFQVSNLAAAISVGDWTQPLVQGEQTVISTRLPGSRVDLADAPLVFAGYGIRAPERQWDDFKGQDMRGKILVVLINDADFEEPELNTFGGRAMTYYGRWTYKYEEAARLGAAGVLIVHESAPASYGWATVRNSWTGPQFDIVRADPAAERGQLEGWIQRDVAVEIFRRAGLDFDALKAAARSRDFQPVTIEGARLTAAYDVETSTTETHNIIARLPGSTRPGETVLYGAHWDHLGVGEPDANGDRIFNGAADNATGTAALIELARLFAAGPRPERSVVFIAFTAEESGLLGSEYYAANPVYPLDRTAGGFNMDSLNTVGRAREVGVIGSGYSDMETDLARWAATQDRTVTGDSRPEAGSYFRSDHFPLAKRGVPMLRAGGGDTPRDLEPAAFAAARADYTANRYHQQDDEWSADWDLRGAAEDVTLLFQIGNELANSTRWPNWNAGVEFKAARDASAAARR